MVGRDVDVNGIILEAYITVTLHEICVSGLVVEKEKEREKGGGRKREGERERRKREKYVGVL